MKHSGILVLADGTIFEGVGVGQPGHVAGEVVFNTAQTGYQEILTDPSYTEQIIVFTQPHIGNVGVNPCDMESDRIFAKGTVMRSFSHTMSNWRAKETLENFLKKQNVIAISDVDTRGLTQHLRTHGSQPGCIMIGNSDVQQALHHAQNFPALAGRDLVNEVTTDKSYSWHTGSWQKELKAIYSADKSEPYHIVVYDFGVKRSILNALIDRGCRVTVVPAYTEAKQILALKPDGLILSNGPGDPAACGSIIANIKELLKQAIPLMAICLGHQLLALASGATTKKMAFGHHGANHPILALKTGAVSISSQNHGFVVAEESLPACLRVTHRSLFDETIAGIERIDLPAFGFQGHPEAGPGPMELTMLFDHFISLIKVTYAKAS